MLILTRVSCCNMDFCGSALNLSRALGTDVFLMFLWLRYPFNVCIYVVSCFYIPVEYLCFLYLVLKSTVVQRGLHAAS